MPHALAELFLSPKCKNWGATALAASALSSDEILSKFELQRRESPRRGLRGKYFMEHKEGTTSSLRMNRREEHLAIALWSAYRKSGFALRDGTILFPVDYQLPLKSHRDAANAGLGKVDLFCCESGGEPWVTELKIRSVGNGRVDTPLKALLEALAYCATLDADMPSLSRESSDEKRTVLHFVSPIRPSLLILATSEYWDECDRKEARHKWREPLQALAQRIEFALKIKVRFVRMANWQWAMPSGWRTDLTKSPICDWAIPVA